MVRGAEIVGCAVFLFGYSMFSIDLAYWGSHVLGFSTLPQGHLRRYKA